MNDSMKKLVFLILISIAFLNLQAQPAGYKPVASLAVFKQQFTAAAQKTTSIKSDFLQEKNLAMLEDKIVSKGKFWFKKNSMVRMEYNQPFQYLMILNQDAVYIKDGQKENKMTTRGNKLFQQINKIMIDCIQGTALENKDFKTAVYENAQGFMIEMIPTVKSLKEFFNTIHIVVNKKDLSVIKIDLIEQGGDNTVINFINKEINATIPDALFTVK
jgi:outer membrane lipoprotein-sorting protein